MEKLTRPCIPSRKNYRVRSDMDCVLGKRLLMNGWKRIHAREIEGNIYQTLGHNRFLHYGNIC